MGSSLAQAVVGGADRTSGPHGCEPFSPASVDDRFVPRPACSWSALRRQRDDQQLARRDRRGLAPYPVSELRAGLRDQPI